MGGCCYRELTERKDNSVTPKFSELKPRTCGEMQDVPTVTEESTMRPPTLPSQPSQASKVRRNSLHAPARRLRRQSWAGPVTHKKRTSLRKASATGCVKYATRRLNGKFENLYEMDGRAVEDSYGPLIVVVHRKTRLERLARVVAKAQEAVDMLNRELAVLQKLDHPYILKIVEVLEDDTRYIFIYESLVDCKIVSYLDIAGKEPEAEIASVAMQLLQVLKYCHSRSVLHGNLCLKNILFLKTKQGSIMVKVMGIGAGRKSLMEKDVSADGLLAFFAPEVFTKGFSEKGDVWACGVILYFLCSGTLPFPTESKSDLRMMLDKADIDFHHVYWFKFSLDVQKFLRLMINPDLSERASVFVCIENGWLMDLFRGKTEVLVQDALKRLQAFRGGRRLKVPVLAFLSANVIPSEEWLRLTRAFHLIDVAGENVVRNEELLEAFTRHFPKKDAITIVSRLMDSLDFDKNGHLTCSEFLLAACNEDFLVTETKLRVSFELMDKDNNGKVGLEELSTGLKLGREDAEWQMLLRSVDKDLDGQLNFEEFVELMRTAMQ